MRRRHSVPLALACTLATAPLAAQSADSAAFIIRLGTDTTAVERYVRTPDRLVAEAIARSPELMRHRLVMDFAAGGEIRRAEWTVREPSAAEPALRRVITFGQDSAVIETTSGGQTRTQRVSAAGVIPIAGPFYSPYELAIRRALAGDGRAADVPLLSGGSVVEIAVERVGTDTVSLANQFGEPMRAAVDPTGRLLGLETPGYTSVERLGWIDLDALGRRLTPLGMLSPQETFRAEVGDANLWVDYYRPAKRGRPVFGGLVPFGEIWRTGANTATHFATDRTLEIGGQRIEPGTYTLFTIPERDSWTLIINRQTGQSGLEHDPSLDVARVPMRVETLERPVENFTIRIREAGDDGVLEMMWDRTRAFVEVGVAGGG